MIKKIEVIKTGRDYYFYQDDYSRFCPVICASGILKINPHFKESSKKATIHVSLKNPKKKEWRRINIEIFFDNFFGKLSFREYYKGKEVFTFSYNNLFSFVSDKILKMFNRKKGKYSFWVKITN